jgi:hypothetical protein
MATPRRSGLCRAGQVTDDPEPDFLPGAGLQRRPTHGFQMVAAGARVISSYVSSASAFVLSTVSGA